MKVPASVVRQGEALAKKVNVNTVAYLRGYLNAYLATKPLRQGKEDVNQFNH